MAPVQRATGRLGLGCQVSLAWRFLARFLSIPTAAVLFSLFVVDKARVAVV